MTAARRYTAALAPQARRGEPKPTQSPYCLLRVYAASPPLSMSADPPAGRLIEMDLEELVSAAYDAQGESQHEPA